MISGRPLRDPTLAHPRSIYQHLARHFARYTPEMVERTVRMPTARFLEIADDFTRRSGPEQTGAICYAVGLTQHSVGAQIIRTAAILQLLLGNIGRPGGGVLALRGHASIQGSTDIPTLYDLLPGYLPMPAFGRDSETLARYVAKQRTPTGWWANSDKYIVSLLKAWYGEAATPRQRLRLRLAAADRRRPLAPGLLARHGGRQDGGPLRHGPEPCGRRAERGARTARARESEVARRPRHGRSRDRDVLARFAGSAIGRSCRRRRSARRCSSSPPPDTRKRKARSRTRSGCCSGTRRPSSRRASAAATCRSSITSAGG